MCVCVCVCIAWIYNVNSPPYINIDCRFQCRLVICQMSGQRYPLLNKLLIPLPFVVAAGECIIFLKKKPQKNKNKTNKQTNKKEKEEKKTKKKNKTKKQKIIFWILYVLGVFKLVNEEYLILGYAAVAVAAHYHFGCFVVCWICAKMRGGFFSTLFKINNFTSFESLAIVFFSLHLSVFSDSFIHSFIHSPPSFTGPGALRIPENQVLQDQVLKI